MERFGCHVGVERDGTEVLEVLGVVEIDRVAGFVQINQLAVGARSDRHPRATREFDFVQQLPSRDVDRPQLVMADGLNENVPTFAVGAEGKTELAAVRSGADRKEVETVLSDIHPADDEQASFL